jgi:hypothetical protein
MSTRKRKDFLFTRHFWIMCLLAAMAWYLIDGLTLLWHAIS